MTGKHLRELLRQEPFRPFTMGLMGKTRVRISRPDWAMVSPDGSQMIAYDDQRELHFVSVPHIASIEFDPPVEPDVVAGE
jgi:hypothetical protein